MGADQFAGAGQRRLLTEPPIRLHHHAYVVKDHEANRHYFEDILGIPLTATWCEETTVQGRKTAMCHTFFSLGDGGALAFFQFADPEVHRLAVAEKPAAVPNFDHIAFKVSERTYQEIIARLKAADIAVRETDHGFCRSCYSSSPDGLIMEFTVDAPNADEIDAIRRADAHTELARWMAGDHRPNNDMRPRGH